jgi:superfamily II DNA or RNA helicase
MQSPFPARGSTVWIRQRPWQVERVTLCKHILRLDVRDRRGPLTFLAPFDRINTSTESRRPKPVSVRAGLARLVGVTGALPRWNSVNAAAHARMDLHAYQLEPALAIIRGVRRVLIADEVGLGKTIQAGLVLAELQRRQASLRALVICPANLRRQWAEEIEARFGLQCRTADQETLTAVAQSSAVGQSPWMHETIWIGSIDYLKQPHVLEGIPLLPWDVVIIDEAHDASGTTERHDICHELACRAHHVLLLTATPHSGDDSRFGRLTSLGRLQDDELLVFRRSRTAVLLLPPRRVRWLFVPSAAAEAKLLDALEAYEQALLRAAGDSRVAAAVLLLSLFRKRALSTVDALVRSLERRLEWLIAPEQGYSLDWMQPSLDFEPTPEDDVGDGERLALIADVGMRPADERTWLRRLLTLAEMARPMQTKLRRLLGLVRRTREPVVVFTEFRDSLDAVRQLLEPVRDVSVLHGGLSLQDRRRALDRFQRGDTTVLLTTDVAGQGLNLQTASRWVVVLELPWNPVRLEQRIGRVDRIGQPKSVHATLLVSRHPAESTLLTRLARRVVMARRGLGNDTLHFAAPPADTVIAMRLFGRDTEDPQPMPIRIPLCTSLVRTGRASAVVMTKRRQLLARWKGEVPHGRPAVCRPRRNTAAWLALTGPTGRAVGVFSVPIVDSEHHILERHLIVVAGLNASCLDAIAIQAAAEVAKQRLDGRRRRLESQTLTATSRAAQVRASVLRRLSAISRPEEVQTQLFSRSAVEAFEQAQRVSRRLHERSNRSGDAQIPNRLAVGAPRLELLIEVG